MTIHFNIADIFESVAAAVPDRTALVADPARRTFAELDARSNQVARLLIELGCQPESKVGIYAWNRVEWVETFLAAFKARAVPINVNYRYVADELAYVIDNADVEVLVFERCFAPLVEQVRAQLPRLRHLVVIDDGSSYDIDALDYEDVVARQDHGPLQIERSADDLYMLYTGGTTGLPKGVMWRHEDIIFAALAGGWQGQTPLTAADQVVTRISPNPLVSLAIAPIMHGAAQWGMSIALLAGGTCVLFTGRGFDADAVWHLVERERVTAVMVVGDAMARPLADSLAEHHWDASSVLTFGSGGAVFSATVQDQLRTLLPGVAIRDSIGASEFGAGGISSPDGTALRFAVTPAMTILDDDLRQAPVGQVGKVARRGHIPLGYYKDPVKTAATFPTDPDGVRWSVPGDNGVIEPDGMVTLLGRGSNCINTGGEKVYPEEVEGAIKSHPDVFDALVVGLADERFGQSVAAVVQPRPGHEVTLESLAAHCRTKIAGYKVPRRILISDSIGRTPSGKPDYPWAKRLFDTAG